MHHTTRAVVAALVLLFVAAGSVYFYSPQRVAKVLGEAVVVGLAFVALFMGVHAMDMSLRPGSEPTQLMPPPEHPSPAMQHTGMGAQAFVAGFIGHVLFEVTGLNQTYANNYHK